jgi:hypothetical protein
VRWAVTRRYASGLTAPASRWTGPAGPLDQDRRWADARRLLHDDAYPAADRVAGLLILLYAQKLNVIAALTIQHVLHQDDRTLLRLGSRPIVLPAPLDALVGALAAGRKAPGTSLLDVPSSWLFPGRRPGSSLTEDALAQRLHALGISPRQSRSTACSPWPPTSAAAWTTDQMPGLPELDIAPSAAGASNASLSRPATRSGGMRHRPAAPDHRRVPSALAPGHRTGMDAVPHRPAPLHPDPPGPGHCTGATATRASTATTSSSRHRASATCYVRSTATRPRSSGDKAAQHP